MWEEQLCRRQEGVSSACFAREGEERRLSLSAVRREALSFPITPPPASQIFKGQMECVFLIVTHIYVWGKNKGLRFKWTPSQAQALAGMQREEELREKRLYYGGPWASVAKS